MEWGGKRGRKDRYYNVHVLLLQETFIRKKTIYNKTRRSATLSSYFPNNAKIFTNIKVPPALPSATEMLVCCPFVHNAQCVCVHDMYRHSDTCRGEHIHCHGDAYRSRFPPKAAGQPSLWPALPLSGQG